MPYRLKPGVASTFGERYIPRSQTEALEYGFNEIMQTRELNSGKIADICKISYKHFRNIMNGLYLFKKKHFYKLLDYYHKVPLDFSTSFLYMKDIDDEKKQLVLIVFNDNRKETKEYEEVVLAAGFEKAFEEIKGLNPGVVEDECQNILMDMGYWDYRDPAEGAYEFAQDNRDPLEKYLLPLRKIVEELHGEEEEVLEEYLEIIRGLKKLRKAGKEKTE
jgi:hypothetical protein